MNDSDLDGMLHSLPREVASESFTPRVMARVARGPRRARALRPRTWPNWAQAFTATLLVVLSVGIGMAWERQQETRRLAALRAEALRLQAEVESLKRASQQPQQIYLGQSGDREYLLDLRQFTAPAAEVRPVSQQY